MKMKKMKKAISLYLYRFRIVVPLIVARLLCRRRCPVVLIVARLLCHRRCPGVAALPLRATPTPPLLDVPVFSLSTIGRCGDGGGGGGDTMNVLTYACPVAIAPHRTWCIGLYKGTASHENFFAGGGAGRGVLQMLRPEHAGLVRTLGGCSGRDVDKRTICDELGYSWRCLPSGSEGGDEEGGGGAKWPLVLPSCAYYLKLELEGEPIDCGSHDAAICRVVSMISDDEGTENLSGELEALSTRKLRELGIISEVGRVIPLDTDASLE